MWIWCKPRAINFFPLITPDFRKIEPQKGEGRSAIYPEKAEKKFSGQEDFERLDYSWTDRAKEKGRFYNLPFSLRKNGGGGGNRIGGLTC